MKTKYKDLKVVKKNEQLYLFLLIIFLITGSCSRNQGNKYSVIRGHFIQSVIETGELQAVNASFLSMPRINYIYGYNFKIIGLAEYGKQVHKGDAVIKVDPSSVQKYIIERSEALENEIASTNKLKAQITNNLQDLRAQLRNEQASYNIKKLEFEKSGFESAGIKKVIALEFRQSDIKLKKIMRNLDLRPKLDSLDLRIQLIKVEQKENDLKAAQEALSKMTVFSPLDGIFVVEENWRTGQAIRVGDDVWLGAPVARIPDVRTMKVKGFIMENDISKINQGMNVVVRLDALPAVPFHGKVASVAKVCVDRDEKKVFRTEIIITESDLRLKPGMTVSCEYITYEGENEIYAPSNCLLEENKHFYVYTRKRAGLRKIEVKTGPSNNLYTIIAGDLKPGQALELPENILTR